jgi:hypothetical protein
LQGALVGTQVSPEQAVVLCDRLQQDHVKVTVLWVRWGEIDLGDGLYSWDKLDQDVDRLQSCGMEVALHVQARPHQLEPSSMPEDLDAYALFLSDLVNHLEDRVRRYSIENEAMSPYLWTDSPEDYFQLLDLAYATIKAADPEAIVLDSGPSSAALSIMYGYSLYQSGDRHQALAVVQEGVDESGSEMNVSRPSRASDLEDWFEAPEAQQAIAWMPLLVEHQHSYDALQFHWYGPWDRVPDLVEWIREQGIVKPIEAWELGRRHRAPAAFDETLHAQETTKLLVTAVGEGSRFTIAFPYVERPQPGQPGLFTRRGPRPAATSFRILASKLNGAQEATRLALAPSVWAYHFALPQGELYVLWTTEGETTIRLPVPGLMVTVTDVEGHTVDADPAHLHVSPSPLFIVP